jgi:hypothetical protein
VEVHRITRGNNDPTVIAYSAEIHVNCVACGEPFRWTGPYDVGASSDRPCVSPDGTELRAPLRPASGDEDFGLGLGGFIVQVRDETGG